MISNPAPTEGQNSQAVPAPEFPKKLKFCRFCEWFSRSIFSLFLFGFMAYHAAKGHDGATNLLMFTEWLITVILFIGILVGVEPPKSTRWKPGFARDLGIYTSVAVALYLVWHGWVWTPISIIFNALAMARPRSDEKPQQEQTEA